LKKGRNSRSRLGIDDVVFIFTYRPKNQASPLVSIYTDFGFDGVICPIRFAEEGMSSFLRCRNFGVDTFLNFPVSVGYFPMIRLLGILEVENPFSGPGYSTKRNKTKKTRDCK